MSSESPCGATPAESASGIGFQLTEFGGGSRAARFLHALLSCSVKPIIGLWSRHPGLRWPYRLVDHLGRVLPGNRAITRERRELTSAIAILITPGTVVDDRFVLYLHGGAFLVGGRHLHRQLTGKLAVLLGAPMLAVDYRKLPAHSIADGIADCVDGYRHILDSGVSPDRIVVMGDSAGGYLTLMTAIEIRRRGLPSPGALVAMSPLTEWDVTAKLAADSANQCAVFPRDAVPRFGEFAERAAAGVPLESPAHCDLTGLPPTLIQASTSEMVYPDSVLMAGRLAAHGVSCELQTWPGQVHVFQAAVALVPEAAEAVAEIGAFVDRVLGAPSLRRTA